MKRFSPVGARRMSVQIIACQWSGLKIRMFPLLSLPVSDGRTNDGVSLIRGELGVILGRGSRSRLMYGGEHNGFGRRLLGRKLFDDAALSRDQNPVRQAEDFRQVRGYDDHRETFVGETADHV